MNPHLSADPQIGETTHAFIDQMVAGYRYSYAVNQNSLRAFRHFSSALKIAETLGQVEFIKAALIGILNLFSHEIYLGSKQFEPYLEQFTTLKSDRQMPFYSCFTN